MDTNMPLGASVTANIRELMKDNKRKGKARGANGRVRSQKQIVAIAMSVARKSKQGTRSNARGRKMKAGRA